MSHDTMRHAQGLLSALEGIKVTPPKVLQNIVNGFDLLGAPIQAVPADPANAILAAAADGKLTAKSLDELLTAAAAETATNNYRQEFRLKAERKFARGFHAALLDGAADQILDGLRPQFEGVAAELTTARDLVDQDTPARLLDVSASAEEQDAWRRLPELVRQISRLGAIAAAFGPTADLAVIDDLTDNDAMLRLGWIDNRALMCCEGDIVGASRTFRQPDVHWQNSAWLRVSPKMATITEAQEALRELAEGDWAGRESQRAGRGTLTAEHGFVPDTRTNPHALPEPAELSV